MRKTDPSRWKRQVEKLRKEDRSQGRLHKDEPAGGGRKVLWLFMTGIDELKDIYVAS